MAEEQIQLQTPELVAMRPEEHREVVRLLAALVVAAQSFVPSRRPPPGHSPAERLAGPLPLGPGGNGKPGSRKVRGGNR